MLESNQKQNIAYFWLWLYIKHTSFWHKKVYTKYKVVNEEVTTVPRCYCISYEYDVSQLTLCSSVTWQLHICTKHWLSWLWQSSLLNWHFASTITNLLANTLYRVFLFVFDFLNFINSKTTRYVVFIYFP